MELRQSTLNASGISDELITVAEVAAFLRLHPNTVYGLVKQGKLPVVRGIGSRIRFRVSDLGRWLDANNFFPPIIPPIPVEICLDGHARLGSKGGTSGLKTGKTRWNFGYGSVYVRKAKSGSPRFYIDYRNTKGERIQGVVKHAQNVTQAAQVLQATVRDMLSATYGLSQPKDLISFGQLADLYMDKYSKVMKRSWKSDGCYLKSLKSFFGDRPVSKISQLDVETYVAARVKYGLKRSSVNRELACLKKMFNKARDWGHLTSNPAEKVKFFSEKEGLKERILSAVEEQRLLAKSPDYLKRMILTALYTGMRRAELLNLKWSDIDQGGLIRLSYTKSGRTRVIPICPELHRLLEELRQKSSENPHIFVNGLTGTQYRDIKRAFRTASRKAEVDCLRFHDLRHTFASRLVERGVDIITVKELLGHSTVRMTERYTHSHMELKRRAVDSLGNGPPDPPQVQDSPLQDGDTAVNSDSLPGLRSMFSVN